RSLRSDMSIVVSPQVMQSGLPAPQSSRASMWCTLVPAPVTTRPLCLIWPCGLAAALAGLLDSSRQHRTMALAEWVRALMEDYRFLGYARDVAHRLASAALHE